LQHLVERLVIITEGPVIEEQDLPAPLTQRVHPAEKIEVVVRKLLPLKEAYQILEQKLLQHALRTLGSAREIAKELGVDHSTILRKINRYKALKTLEGHSPRG
jgi:transcriptional regulator with PAS, ATPase and Fis domain